MLCLCCVVLILFVLVLECRVLFCWLVSVVVCSCVYVFLCLFVGLLVCCVVLFRLGLFCVVCLLL